MRFSLVSRLCAICLVFVFALGGSATLHVHLQPRSDVLTIPMHTFPRRSPADPTTFGAGISSVSWASDRQSYYTIIQVAGLIYFRVALDTASSDLWLVSSGCTTETCKEAAKYPLLFPSPTFLAVNGNTTAFNAQYADGTFASGFVAEETITLSNFTLANQTFGLVSDTNLSLSDRTSGVLGLGFPRLSTISSNVPDALPFFPTLAQQGLLEYPIFGVSLKANDTGTLALGAIDASVVTNISLIGWNKVAQFPPFGAENNMSSYLQWVIPLSGIVINETQLSPIPTYASIGRNSSLALIDLGASGIYGPYQDVERIYSMIDGARLVDPSGQWVVPCSTTVTLSFTFGLQNYTLQPTDFLIGPASGNPNLCFSWPMAHPPSSDGIDWQMGSVFLRTVYTIFSYGIDGKEPPLIGLYSLSTNVTETTASISSFLSSNSVTVATTLPNYILPTPSFTTPPYGFNASVSASIGGIVSSGLANSTYSAIFAQHTTFNASALPTITPPPTVVTLTITDTAGNLSTVVSTYSMEAITLGLPGFNAAACLRVSLSLVIIPSIVIVWTLFSDAH